MARSERQARIYVIGLFKSNNPLPSQGHSDGTRTRRLPRQRPHEGVFNQCQDATTSLFRRGKHVHVIGLYTIRR